MTSIEQINKIERLLHAAKGRLREQRNQRWISAKHKGALSPHNVAIDQTEAEILKHRQTLKNLYSTI